MKSVKNRSGIYIKTRIAHVFAVMLPPFCSSLTVQHIFPPDGVDMVYDSTMTLKAHAYFVNEAEPVVYIYGADDTWSATGARPDTSLHVLVYYLEGKDHRKARIQYMSKQQQLELEAFLEKILKTDIPGANTIVDRS